MAHKLDRRRFLAAAAGYAASAAMTPALLKATDSNEKPNVLFIAVDDLRPELSCYGAEHIISPNIDRLAREGLLFERTYCQQAVCAPSRISIMTGMRPDTTKVYDLETPLRKAMPDVLSLPQHFKNNGYETLSIGKIYHHSSDDRIGWTQPPYRSNTVYKDRWQGRGYVSDKAISQMRAYNKQNPGTTGRGPAFDAADVADNMYPDGANTDYALKKLGELKDKPFFMAMGLYKPHLPFNAPKKYWNMYKRDQIKLAENPFIPKNAPDYATTSWGELRNYCGIPKKGPCSDDLARELMHGYYACVTYIDAQVGRLLDELDRLKIRRKTVVILWGDHGWKLGEHAGWCKHTNFELDTHVPMILSVPGMKTAGKRTWALTEYVDIYPTLCQACGLEIPDDREGLSVMPLLADPECSWKTAAFSQYPRGKVMGYSMRTRRFRYTEWQDRKTARVLARELYDHREDPDENVNAADESRYSNEVVRLSRMLKRNWRGALPENS